jgi:hypothetical protein
VAAILISKSGMPALWRVRVKPLSLRRQKTADLSPCGTPRRQDGILFIHNVDHFLSKEEDQQLDGLLAQAAGRE